MNTNLIMSKMCTKHLNNVKKTAARGENMFFGGLQVVKDA